MFLRNVSPFSKLHGVRTQKRVVFDIFSYLILVHLASLTANGAIQVTELEMCNEAAESTLPTSAWKD